MGTWDIGTFDDDTAADFLYDLLESFYQEIESVIDEPSVIEPDEYDGIAIICRLELIVLIGKQKWGGTFFPDEDIIKNWKRKYLMVWDKYMDKFESYDGEKINSSFSINRRAVIEKKFDELILLSKNK